MGDYDSIGPKVLESKTLRWVVAAVSAGISIGSAVTFIKGTYVTEKRAAEIVGPVSAEAGNCNASISQLKRELADYKDSNADFNRQLVLGMIRNRAKVAKGHKIDVSQLLAKYDSEIRNGQTPAAAVEHLLLELE